MSELANGKSILPFRSIDDLIVSVCPTGSAFTCDPPVITTDIDYLVLTEPGRLDECGCRLDKYKFTNCFADWVDKKDTDDATLDETGYAVETASGARFSAWRRDELNLIVTDDMAFYLRSVGATLIAKRLNLQSKAHRIELFRCLKFGNEYTGPLP